MSPNEKKALEKVDEGQQNVSVFDFLYHDARRVGSFLAQFDDSGHLKQITQSETAERSRPPRSFELSGGLGAEGIGKGEFSFKRGAGTTTGSERADRVYDPLWVNALSLLDYLTERELICRDIWSARIGQFVLVEGTLVILDLDVLKALYDDGAVSSIIRSGMPTQIFEAQLERPNRPERRKAGSRNASPPTSGDMFLSFLRIMPHSVQLRLYGEDFRVWTTPDPEYLVSRPSDLILKHGSIISGDWKILGILDALPDGPDGEMVPVPDDLAAVLGGSPLGTVAAMFGPMARFMVGRPGSAHGMTPLLVFREVSGEVRSA